MIELKRDNFKEVIDREGIILIECWVPGCGACVAFDPIFAKVAEQHNQHSFVRMNLATEENLSEFFEIEHTPCLMLYRDGLLLLKKPGNFSENDLNDIIKQAESLDMAMVRASLETSQTQSQEGGEDNARGTE
jgi:thioredoxin 1